jgi:PAS domain-containing protein
LFCRFSLFREYGKEDMPDQEGSKNLTLQERTDSCAGASTPGEPGIAVRVCSGASEEFLKQTEGIISAICEPLFFTDAKLNVLLANRSFYQTFLVGPGDIEGKPFYEMGDCRQAPSDLRHRFEQVVCRDASVDNLEVVYAFPRVGQRSLLLNARRVNRNGAPPLILVTVSLIIRSLVYVQPLPKRDGNRHDMGTEAVGESAVPAGGLPGGPAGQDTRI